MRRDPSINPTPFDKIFRPNIYPLSFHAQNGYTPLHVAAANGQVGTVRLLFDSGADKDAKSKVRRKEWGEENI